MAGLVLHPVLKAALSAAKIDRVGSPLDRTTPSPPWLAPGDLAALVLWFVERTTAPAAGPELEKVAFARALLRDPSAMRADHGNVEYPVERASLFSLAIDTANRVHRNPAATIVAAKAAAKMGVRIARREKADVRSLVRELEAELFRLEACALIAGYGPTDRVAAVVFRAEGERRGRLGHAIVRLDDGAFGLLTKHAGRYRWFEGERDEILATAPDVIFEDAADIVRSQA